MQTKKKKMLTTGLAVALAALLLIGGGTFAYLQSASDDVVNEFDANKVQVELKESGDGNYNIISRIRIRGSDGQDRWSGYI